MLHACLRNRKPQPQTAIQRTHSRHACPLLSPPRFLVNLVGADVARARPPNRGAGGGGGRV
eukprot:154650-Chlamydomonas_euryale.AAC.1